MPRKNKKYSTRGFPILFQGIADTLTDMFYTVPTVKFLRDLANATRKMAGRTPVGSRYLYLFNHYPASKAGLEELKGVSHGEDLAYQFDPYGIFTRDAFNADDYTVGTTFRLMLTNFAKTGCVGHLQPRSTFGFGPKIRSLATGNQCSRPMN